MASVYSTQEPSAGGSVYNPRLYGFEQGGKLRFTRGTMEAIAAAKAVDSTINLCRIPQGRVRVLPHLSVMWCSAWGAARVLDLGFRSYYGSDGKTLVAEAPTQIINNKDVSSALNASVLATIQPIDFYSQCAGDDKSKGPMLFGTVQGDEIPIGATLDVLLAYLYL